MIIVPISAICVQWCRLNLSLPFIASSSPLGNEQLSSVNWFLPHTVSHIKHMHLKLSGTTLLSLGLTLHTYRGHTGLYLSLWASIHLVHEENSKHTCSFSCLLASNPPNPLFPMLGIYAVRIWTSVGSGDTGGEKDSRTQSYLYQLIVVTALGTFHPEVDTISFVPSLI